MKSAQNNNVLQTSATEYYEVVRASLACRL